jgi:hypothetical protein
LTTRLEYPGHRLRRHNRISEQRTKGAGKHVGILVFATVAVEGRAANMRSFNDDERWQSGSRFVIRRSSNVFRKRMRMAPAIDVPCCSIDFA